MSEQLPPKFRGWFEFYAYIRKDLIGHDCTNFDGIITFHESGVDSPANTYRLSFIKAQALDEIVERFKWYYGSYGEGAGAEVFAHAYFETIAKLTN